MTSSRKVRWTEIPANTIKFLFSVWSHRELEWAKRAWHILEKHGLTSYSSEMEKTLVFIRLMTLATIYKEFCDLAWDEWNEPMYTVWASELDINRYRVAQSIGPEFAKDSNETEEDLLSLALAELVDLARAEISDVLIKDFGGESALCISLWRTAGSSEEDSEGEGQPEEDDYSIVNNVTAEKGRAFEWIQEGMPRVR